MVKRANGPPTLSVGSVGGAWGELPELCDCLTLYLPVLRWGNKIAEGEQSRRKEERLQIGFQSSYTELQIELNS